MDVQLNGIQIRNLGVNGGYRWVGMKMPEDRPFSNSLIFT